MRLRGYKRSKSCSVENLHINASSGKALRGFVFYDKELNRTIMFLSKSFEIAFEQIVMLFFMLADRVLLQIYQTAFEEIVFLGNLVQFLAVLLLDKTQIIEIFINIDFIDIKERSDNTLPLN